MDSLSQIPRLGPKTLEKLHRLNIHTPRDLVYHFPSRYLDFSKVVPISQAQVGETITLTGVIKSFQNIFTHSHKNIQRAIVADKTGTIELLWFNQPYLSKTLLVGQQFSFAGTVSLYKNHLTIIAPAIGQHHTGKIVAVYPETKGLSSSWFRTTIQNHLHQLTSTLTETLPPSLIDRYQLVDRAESLRQIHCPTNFSSLESARYRLALEEILGLQVHSHLQKQSWLTKKPAKIFQLTSTTQSSINKFINSLPFALTSDQLNAWKEISADLLSSTPTHRLLQGDVGSGKTIVALLACLLAHHNRSLSLVVAPTEILAQQHAATFQKLLPTLPIKLLTATHRLSSKELRPGSILVSTHSALFHKEKIIPHLGLVVFDEQHKFGVNQRNFLSDAVSPPHSLTMTATPIPRTVGLTLMGSLSLTTINSLPQNRQPIKTFLVPPSKVDNCYSWLEKHLKDTGEQAFVVCPFIEESETLSSVKSAKQEFDHLQQVFSSLKVGLIHGKTKTTDRQKILDDFAQNKISILVTTPLIEVGIDYPNATTIIIQSADRFGLASLHQLRGRVGRGSRPSSCYLFSESKNDQAISRLHFLESHSRGMDIAEFDLKNRGPGELFSTIQHGFPTLRLSQLNDYELISTAQKLLADLIRQHPNFDLTSLLPIHHQSLTSNLN